jgi:hypothetical protein
MPLSLEVRVDAVHRLATGVQLRPCSGSLPASMARSGRF